MEIITDFLNKIRTPDKDLVFKRKVINTSLVLALGVVLGILSKWLDNLAIDDTIWWQHILGVLDLRNVFSDFGIWIFAAIAISVFSRTPLRASLNVFLFFVGMTVSYHLYTIMFSGFNPSRYMMIWYGITAITPILAFICWYAKGKGIISLIINSVILTIMLLSSFGIGLWYFDLKSIIGLLIFGASIFVLYQNPKSTIISLIIALLLAYGVKIVGL